MSNIALKWIYRRKKIDNVKTSPEEYKALASVMYEYGYFSGAIAFANKGNDKELILKVLEKACEEGDFLLFKQAIVFINKDEFSVDKLKTLISSANNQGKFLYASSAEKYLKENY